MSVTANQRPKFEFLDGLRGISALYVAIYHTTLFTGKVNEPIPALVKPFTFFAGFGHFSVSVFIVLSGFCLSIPVALSEDKQLRGGFKNYIRRRFRRIVPPYYAALLLFIGLIAITPLLQIPLNTAWDTKIPFNWQTITTHFLLIHNLHVNWIYKIDGPMWSVATEWQIYFFFPLLLLIWRKSNLAMAVLTSVIIGIVACFFKLSLLHPWFLGLFGIGMGGAIIAFSNEALFVHIREVVNWKLFSRLSATGVAVFLLLTTRFPVPDLISETVVGAGICVVIIYYTLIEKKGQTASPALRFLKSPQVVMLGVFSYSIYLIHSPFVALFNLLTLHNAFSYPVRLLYMLFIALPSAIGLAYIFHILVERRFVTGHIRKEARKLRV
jgi:peptidoglycan/LPS O-acetylase OafA/YrhL